MTDFKKIIERFKKELKKYPNVEFEIFCMREENFEVEVKDGLLHADNFSTNMGAAIRVIFQKKLGFAYTTDLSSKAISLAIERGVSLSSLTNSNSFLRLPKPLKGQSNFPGKSDDKNLINKPQLIENALELERSALDFDPKVKRVRGASCAGNRSEVYLMNSWGIEKHHQTTMNTLSLMAVAEKDEEAEVAYEFDFSCFFDNLNPEETGKRAAQKAMRYLGAKPGPTYKGAVLLDCLVASEILEVLAPSFYADHLVKQRSLFSNQEGEKILSSSLTLIDDATREDGFASFPFDGEGVSRRQIRVVEKGIFKQPLIDTEYGDRLQKESTGSSIREDIRKLPRIGYSNFYIEPGKPSFEEVLKKIDSGIYITELIGIHTADPISGDFSVGAQGFLIEKGEIANPIKQIALSGNLKEMMNRVDLVANDLRFYFKVGSPSLLISSLDLAGV